MSTALVREQIASFLKSPKPAVLCVRGNWGTGKTYTWKTALEEAATKPGGIALEKYASVSLFGINSVSDVKQELIHETISRERIGKEFNPEDVNSIYQEGLAKLTRGASWFGGIFGDGYVNAGVSLMSLFIRKRLICIDDLERKGESLRSADVLGLISQLKEDRDCKIVLLLNDEQLEDKDEFESYLEKVVDINLRFKPTPEESATIALKDPEGSAEVAEMVRNNVTKLGIDNVRVIRKLHSFVLQIEPLLKGYAPGVFKSVALTLVLMGWCHLQPEFAPSKDFLVRRRGIFSDYIAKEKGEFTPKELQWTQLIANYGYSHTDEFDVALLSGIEDGFFTKAIIDAHAAELNQRVEADLASIELRDIWRDFHNSFDGELDVHLERFTECITKYGKFYSLNDMLAVVNMFRDLDRNAAGDQLLDLYLEARKEVKGAYDFHDVELFGTRLDQDIKSRLLKLDAGQKPAPPVEELFLLLADEGHNRNITERLAALPVEEYVRVLKLHKGDNFRAMRAGLTQYNNLLNPDEFNIQIMRKANSALQQIALENPLNKFRVSRWGIAERLARNPQAPAQDAQPAQAG
ncbi:hypothetical protein EN745_18875 [Mesorhizobium sp. M4A.F.Ca.ET.022.05.2.1]|uniref:hypothetical protein n=1 Tax=unclassified Mesorhizobium TaxID=325217 RepID=UPI000FCA7D99|nr:MULTISPECIES: hypothetical protein [unclassified Mesorhizobium]RVC78447.1 hypothetical protein EN745_18875 [Mesorhizobium sp. M4A.F.Ca.ET.022.05.2.1]TIW33894.1 MAG: hypothetical protein E5V62_18465 [Mesorhizobium sp.]